MASTLIFQLVMPYLSILEEDGVEGGVGDLVEELVDGVENL